MNLVPRMVVTRKDLAFRTVSLSLESIREKRKDNSFRLCFLGYREMSDLLIIEYGLYCIGFDFCKKNIYYFIF